LVLVIVGHFDFFCPFSASFGPFLAKLFFNLVDFDPFWWLLVIQKWPTAHNGQGGAEIAKTDSKCPIMAQSG
jgi:hypothetical protein